MACRLLGNFHRFCHTGGEVSFESQLPVEPVPSQRSADRLIASDEHDMACQQRLTSVERIGEHEISISQFRGSGS